MFLQALGQRDVVKVVIGINGSAQCLLRQRGCHKRQVETDLWKNIHHASEKI